MRSLPLLLLLTACSGSSVDSTPSDTGTEEVFGDASGDGGSGATDAADATVTTDANEATDSSDTTLTEEEQLRATLDPAPCAVAAPLAWSPLPTGEAFDGERRYSPLSTINVDRGVVSLFATAEHEALVTDRRSRRAEALASCREDRGCLVAGLSWSEEEVARLSALLAPAQAAVPSLRNEALATGYPFGLEVPAEEGFLSALVTLQVALQNQAIARAVNEAPRPALDTAVAGAEAATVNIVEESGRLATALLLAAGRDEAFRYGPDAADENGAAVAAIPNIDFAAYPYTAILVPGQGPTDDTTALNPAGINRINTAVARWRAGLAPLLLVSGGHVHPDKTPFCEAIEMRRYLVETLAIPPEAILVDPYARHTTTNIRNAARVLQGAGVPMERPILVTSDLLQLAGIVFGLAPRCEEELGFVPWQALGRLDATDACAVLTPDSQRLDRGDSLDP